MINNKIESGSTITPDDIEGPWVKSEDLEGLPPEVERQLPDLTSPVNGEPHVPVRTIKRLTNAANGKANNANNKEG
jgi:hypothetical protein